MSPKWLENISPCINVLCQLATSFNDALGSGNSNTHTSPDISNDLREIVKSLQTHCVYIPEEECKIDYDKAQVPNIVLEGLQQLPVPLQGYNDAFNRLKLRHQMKPLIGVPIVSSSTLDTIGFVSLCKVTGNSQIENEGDVSLSD